MFTPALQMLKKHNPSAQIDALVMINGVRDMYSQNPDIENVHHFNFLREGFLKSLKYIFSLRGKYDTTINVYPSNRKEYNVINFLLGAKKRAGIKYNHSNFFNLGWLNNITIREDDTMHNVQENVRLVEKITGTKFIDEKKLQLNLSPKHNAFAEKFFSDNRIIENDLIIGFHPGCATLKNHIKRRWAPEKFAELGKKLIENKNAKILMFGGPDEKELKEEVLKLINSNRAIVVDTPDLLMSAAVMKRCYVFITNDSSLMHVSSALELPVVAIIGPTNTNYIHPWKTEHKIVSLHLECSPCFFYSPRPLICKRTDVKFKCIKELSVDMVYDAANNFISKGN